MTNPRIIVTGATGKAGSLVVAKWLKTGYPVRTMDYDALPENQRTFSNWLRQLVVVITPFSPGFDLDRFDRELRRALPSEPRRAPESTIWRREHGIAAS